METYSCIRYGTQYGNIFLYRIWNSIWKHILVSNTAIYVRIYKTSYPRKLLLWKWNSGERLEGILKTVVICAL